MLYSHIKRTLILASLGASLVPLASVQAQRVEPMRFELEPSGSAAQTTMVVTNTRSFPITVEIIPSSLQIAADGSETLAPADDDFLIFPPQAVVQPGSTQSIRVRYIGEGVLDTSRAYRIGVNQLPIDMTEDGASGVSVTVNFATLVNIVPDNVSSELTVTELSAAPEGRWRMLVTNNGNRYARMPEQVIRIAQGDQSAEFTSGQTRGWFNKNLILPGSQLYVTIPAQEGFDPQQATITLVSPS